MARELLGRDFRFYGEYADIIVELKEKVGFSANIQVMYYAALVGIIFGEKGKRPETFDGINDIHIAKDTMKSSPDYADSLMKVYRYAVLLDDGMGDDENRFDKAFHCDHDGERAAHEEDILESYVMGGLHLLQKEILNKGSRRGVKKDIDYTRDFYNFIKRIKHEKVEVLEIGKPLTAADMYELGGE